MQLALDIRLPASYAADDVVRTASNAALLALLDAPPPPAGILLHGPHGSGKTHLAHRWAQRHHAVWITASQVGRRPAEQLLGGRKLAVIDDWEQAASGAGMVGLLNELRAREGSVVVTGVQLPDEEHAPLPDVRSRLQGLMLQRIPEPDDALIEGILLKRFSDLQWNIEPDVMHYLLPRMGRGFHDITALFDQLSAVLSTTNRSLTVPLLRRSIFAA